jgi:hypothetical protein
MGTWERSTVLLVVASAIAACPHDFTRRGRDGGASDGDARAGDAHPRDLAREPASCRTAAECDDSLPCTEDTCTSGRCAHSPRSGQCWVGGACYAAGDISTKNPCERCDPWAGQLALSLFPGKGCVTTIAGGSRGFADGPALSARFNNPSGIALGSSGTVYVADSDNHSIRALSSGTVTTIAGAPQHGLQDGKGTDARFYRPWGAALSPLDGLVVTDVNNHAIRRVDLETLIVSTLVGDGTAGYADGPAATAKLAAPAAVARGPGGIYFASQYRIRLIADDNPRTVTTVAGTGVAGFKDGPAASAQFSSVQGLAVLDQDNIFVSDGGLYGHRIRHIRREGAATQVATLAGGNEWFFQDGPGGQARFATPCGLVVVGAGSSSYVLYVADRDNNRIRKVSVLGASVTVSTLAGITVAGYQDGMAAAAQFYEPVGLAMDAAGLIYVADVANDAIRVITPP